MTARAAARRYARALFDVALKESDIERVNTDLEQFARLIAEHEGLSHTLTSPAVPAAKKRAVVQALLERAGGLPPVLVKFLLLLADRDRLTLLPDVAASYRERLLDHHKIVRGEVITAMPLPAERLEALEQRLGQATGRTVVLDARVDPSIIGGVITRIGSTVYDGSITTQLQKMKETLTESVQ